MWGLVKSTSKAEFREDTDLGQFHEEELIHNNNEQLNSAVAMTVLKDWILFWQKCLVYPNGNVNIVFWET